MLLSLPPLKVLVPVYSISTSILKGLSTESAVMLLSLPPLKVLVPVALRYYIALVPVFLRDYLARAP